jgi:glycosyltransferase involved in cell wall biosynthesis
MKVLVSVVGRFHAFDLARELHKNDLLFKLVTTYPKFIVCQFGIPKSFVVSELILEVINRYRKFIFFIDSDLLNRLVRRIHDLNCSRIIKKADIFIGWSGMSHHSLIAAKKNKVVSILERGSTHIAYQYELLLEEYTRQGVTYNFDQVKIDAEISEYEAADYISVPSTFVLNSFLEKGVPREKLLLNAYGVNIAQFPYTNNRTEKFKIIFVGAATLRKGFHYLLEALDKINDPEIELVHVGDVHEEIIPFKEKFPKANVRYEGVKKQSDLYKYYGKSYVFVLPSIEEGMAMVLLQAMCCGLPVICTTNTGGGDLIEEGEEGYVLEVRDVDSLCERILYFKNNLDIAQEMGKKAKEKIVNNFTWEKYGERYAKNLTTISNLNE